MAQGGLLRFLYSNGWKFRPGGLPGHLQRLRAPAQPNYGVLKWGPIHDSSEWPFQDSAKNRACLTARVISGLAQ